MSKADLPPAKTERWVASRKAAVVLGIASGLLSRAEACDEYGLSAEELESWCKAAQQHGLQGLKTTRTQSYRQL